MREGEGNFLNTEAVINHQFSAFFLHSYPTLSNALLLSPGMREVLDWESFDSAHIFR